MMQSWTQLATAPDALKVHVSTDGSDSNDGLSPDAPKRTVAAGVELLRHECPDWLLLRRGDVFQGQHLGHWKKSGRSTSEPMVLTSYGPDELQRPLLLTPSGGIWTDGGGGSPKTIDYLAVVGLDFTPEHATGEGDRVGARMLQPGRSLLFEDCRFSGYSTNLVFQGWGGRIQRVALRRSVIVDAHVVHALSGEHAQGLYAYAVDGLLIEECVFDHNGWSATVPGAGADIYSHNLYIDNGCTHVTVRGNLIANAASHGMQLRCGGKVLANLFLRNSIALSVGLGNEPEPLGVTCDVIGNAIIDGKDIDDANPRGWGMVLGNIERGRVMHNRISGNRGGRQPSMVTFDGVHKLAFAHNTLADWGGSIVVRGQNSGIEFFGNRVDGRGDAPLVQHIEGATAGFRSSRNKFSLVRGVGSPVGAGVWFEVADRHLSLAAWEDLVGEKPSSLVDPSASPELEIGVDELVRSAREQSRQRWDEASTAFGQLERLRARRLDDGNA